MLWYLDCRTDVVLVSSAPFCCFQNLCLINHRVYLTRGPTGPLICSPASLQKEFAAPPPLLFRKLSNPDLSPAAAAATKSKVHRQLSQDESWARRSSLAMTGESGRPRMHAHAHARTRTGVRVTLSQVNFVNHGF